MQRKSVIHWSHEGTHKEKLSHSIQQPLYREPTQDVPLMKQGIYGVYSVMTTEIRKYLDPPGEFQLQPNEEHAQHVSRQDPINPQGESHQIRMVDMVSH